MKVELALETVTPLFLGGAAQQAELRPSSMRGALRYWLRALLGGIIGDNNLGELQRLEAEVFGSTEGGSAVVVRLSQPSFQQSKEPLLPHKNQAFADAVPAGISFDLTLSLRPRTELRLLEVATWSVLLWLTLGGIGRRSRRGAGSLRVKEVLTIPKAFPPELKACLSAAEATAPDGPALANRIGRLLGEARQAFIALAHTTSPPLFGNLPSFSILLPDTRIIVWTPPGAGLKDYKSAIVPLMNKMSGLKSSLGNSFEDAFGGISPRRASPMHVTAHLLENEWALVLTYLRAKIRSNRDGNLDEVNKFLDGLNPSWQSDLPAVHGGQVQ